jgi:hypothetical protein
MKQEAERGMGESEMAPTWFRRLRPWGGATPFVGRASPFIAVSFGLSLFVFLPLALAQWGSGSSCRWKFPLWFGCVLDAHDNLAAGLIGAAGALFAAWLAWRAVQHQINADRERALADRQEGDKQLEVARKAADAASLNAQAVIRMQVPYVIFNLRLFGPQTNDAEVVGYPGEASTLRIGVEVVGRGIVEPIGIRAQWSVVEMLPEIPQYESGHNIHCVPGSVSWKPENPCWHWSCPLTLQEDEIATISEKGKRLWVFGYLSFNDVIGNPHETRFCARWEAFHPQPDGPKSMFIYDERTPISYSRKT